jgi:hypothetical protein
MNKIYVIATNWRDCDIEMYQFYTPNKAVKYISELATEDGFRKADPTDDPQDYLSEYHSYLRDEDVYNHKYNIALHIIDLKKEVNHA